MSSLSRRSYRSYRWPPRQPTPQPPLTSVASRAVGVTCLLAALLAGCTTVGPSFQPPTVDAPAQWSGRHGGDASLAAPLAAAGALPADRWGVFGDPELSHLQALALLANADLRTAALRVAQARVEQDMASAQRGPQAAARGGVSRQRLSEVGSGTRLVDAIGGSNTQHLLDVLSAPFTLYQAGFDASWEPDFWGRVARTEEAAQAGTDAQRAALRQMQLSLSAEIARAYFDLRSAQRQRQLTRLALADAQELDALLAAQVQGGLADESALNAQHAQLAGLRAQLPALLAQEAQATNRITLLCGVEPGTLNDELAPAPATDARQLDALALPDLRLGLPAGLARRRPDVAAAEARLHAATASIGIAVADLYPRITLGASFGFESVGSNSFGEWGSRQWSVGPSLSLPLFDQGRRRSTITLRELQQQEAAVAFQHTVLQAWHEVDDAISAYVAETRRDAQFRARAGSAQDEAGLAQSRYANGLTSYLPVLRAQGTAIDAQRDLATSRARVQTALAALYKSLGDDADPRGGPGRAPSDSGDTQAER